MSTRSNGIDHLAITLPELASDMLGTLEHDLEVKVDDSAKSFIASKWNRAGSSYRSPWSNTFIPATSSSLASPLSSRTRNLEVTLNESLSLLKERLWKSAVSSVYLKDERDGSIEGVVLVRKVHQFFINHAPHASTASYTLNSTIELRKDSRGGSTSNSTFSEMPMQGPATIAQHASHTQNVLTLIEQEEIKLRETLQEIYLSVAPTDSFTSSPRTHSYPPTRDSYAEQESRGLLDEFGIDDSMPSPSSSPPAQIGPFTAWLRSFLQIPLRILAVPIGLLGIAFGIIARLLRIRPSHASLRPRNPFGRDARSLQRIDPTSSAERFVRSIEELTGAVRWSRRFGESQGSSSGIVVGSSSSDMNGGLTSRNSSGAPARKVLPDFWIGSYESALKIAKDEIRIVMVVLTCDEHEDDEEFKRRVLTDHELVNALSRERVVVWGGDIRDVDAYQAGKALQYFRLPFVAFIALQPQSTTSSSSPKLTVISRLEGSPNSTLSASSIFAHLTNVVLPRVNPFLARLKAQQVARLEERRLRDEQDRAFAIAARKDEERVLKKRAEEGKRKKDEEDKLKKEEEIRRVREGSKQWRAWKRGQLAKLGEKEGVRIGVRLGDGRRAVRSFAIDAKIEDVYDFVECALETDDGDRRDAPPHDYEHVFEFRLATTFPRNVLEIDGHAGTIRLGEIEWLQKGASLVVEGLEQRRISLGESADSDEELEDDDA